MKLILRFFIVVLFCIACFLQSQYANSAKWFPLVSGNVGCSQATSWLGRVSTSNSTAYTTLICYLVNNNSVWTSLDDLHIFATDSTTNALLNLVSTNSSATVHGTPTFTSNVGYTGTDASSTIFIDTGYNPSSFGGNYTQNSAHIGIWSNTNAASSASGGFAFGISTNASYERIFPKYSDGNFHGEINQNSTFSGPSIANSKGHFLNNRSGVNAVQYYQNASVFTSSTVTSFAVYANATTAADFFVLAGQQNGAGTTGSALQIMGYSVGGNLTSAQVTTLCHGLNVYFTTVAGISSGTC